MKRLILLLMLLRPAATDTDQDRMLEFMNKLSIMDTLPGDASWMAEYDRTYDELLALRYKRELTRLDGLMDMIILNRLDLYSEKCASMYNSLLERKRFIIYRPDRHSIAVRAYELWERQGGEADKNWLQSERELTIEAIGDKFKVSKALNEAA